MAFLTGWTYRKPIQVQTDNLDASLTGFPLLVKITNDSDVSTNALANGYDIRFTSADGTTLLSYERESYSSGTGVFWVKTDVAQAGSTIYLYYGKSDATDGSSNAAWDSNYKGVYHANGSTDLVDSTSNANTIPAVSYPSFGSGGMVGNKASLDGYGAHFEKSGSLASGYPCTLECWWKPGWNTYSYQGLVALCSASATGTSAHAFFIDCDGNGPFRCIAGEGSAGGNVVSSNTYWSWDTSKWYHVVGILSSTSIQLVVNGTDVVSQTRSWNPTLQDATTIGCYYAPNDGSGLFNYLSGDIDEIRVSNTARSLAWVKFQYYNTSSSDNELTIGDEENNIQDGWLEGFAYRKPITIQTDQVTANLSGFPLLVKFSDSDIGAHALTNGYDIRFTQSNGVVSLPYERESFSISGGVATGTYWVKSSVLTTGSTIYVYWGKADATDGNNPTAVWDSGFKAVWHLTGTADSTSNNNTLNKTTANATGKISGGQQTNGTSTYLYSQNNIGISGNASRTLSIWAKVESHGNPGCLIGYGSGYTGGMFYLSCNVAGQNCVSLWGWGDYGYDYTTSVTAADNTWHHLAVTYAESGNDLRIFVDGVQQLQANTYGYSTPDGIIKLGQGNDSYAKAILDEARVSNVVRSPAWIEFEHANQSSADNELTFGTLETIAPTERSHTSIGGLLLGGSGSHRTESHGSRSHSSVGGLLLGGYGTHRVIRSHTSIGGLLLGGKYPPPSCCAGDPTTCSGTETGILQTIKISPTNDDGSWAVDQVGTVTQWETKVQFGVRSGGA